MFSRLAVLLYSALLLAGCSSTQLLQSYKNPEATEKVNKILILGVAKTPGARQMFEAELAKQLTSSGVSAIPSFTVIPNDEELTKEQIIQTATKQRADAVIVTKVINTKEEQEYVTTVQSDAGRYQSGYHRNQRDWYNNYSSGYTTVHSYKNNYTIANVETSLYLLKTETLIWSALSETIVLNSGVKDIQDLVKTLVRQLKDEGLI